jgi:hypothetical protein
LISSDLWFHVAACKTPNEIWTTLESLFGKQDEMRGHMLEVELNTLDPKSFDNIQDLFTKFKSLILSLASCGIDKSKQVDQLTKHMHSPCMMEKDHPNIMGRRNIMRRRDIPNPSTILQVPKTLQIPRRRRRRESSALTAIKNHEESTCMKKQIDLMAQTLQQNNLGNFIPHRESRSIRKKILLLRKVIIMLLLQLIPHLIHGL